MVTRALAVFMIGLTVALAGCGQDQKEVAGPSPADVLPPTVRAGFEKHHPGVMITAVETETYPDGTVHYEVQFTDQDRKPMKQEFDFRGNPLAGH